MLLQSAVPTVVWREDVSTTIGYAHVIYAPATILLFLHMPMANTTSLKGHELDPSIVGAEFAKRLDRSF